MKIVLAAEVNVTVTEIKYIRLINHCCSNSMENILSPLVHLL